jgi:Spy/CpxP family protein refolding chaperone
MALPAILCSLPNSRADQIENGAKMGSKDNRFKIADVPPGPGGHFRPGACAPLDGFHGAPPPFPPPFGPPRMPSMELPLIGLDLSDSQIESLHSRKVEADEKLGPLMLQLHSKHRKLFELLTQTNVDAGAVRSLQSEISDIRAKVDALMVDQLIATNAILTSEQKTKMRMEMMRKEINHPMPPPPPMMP